jgi:hypothetical protein
MAIVKKISELTPKGSALALTDLLVVGVDNGSDYDLKSVTGAELMGSSVSQTITDGVTTKSPSENVVYDSLALKVDKVVGSRLITSSESTLLGNTSGINTGDETVTTIKSKLGITTLSGSNTGDQDLSGYATNSSVVKLTGDQTIGGIKTLTNELKLNDKLYLNETVTPAAMTGYTTLTSNGSQFVLQNGANTAAATFVFNGARTYTLPSANGTLSLTSDLTNKVDGNTAITGATKTKITYDSKGLVTSGADATTADIADSTNKRYVTDANLTVIGNTSGTNTGDQTFLDARVQSVTSSATVTPISTNDLVKITAQAVGLTLANPTGTFTEGQALMIRIKDNGTARTIAFDTNYRAIGVTLPTTTVISKTLYLGIIYNSTDSKFDVIGYNIQA